MKLTSKIEELGKVFNTPNYFFSKTSDNKEIMLFFEGKDGKYEFRGQTMEGAVKKAEIFAKENFSKKEDDGQLKLNI